MRKLPELAILALAGIVAGGSAALAAESQPRVMDVPLPDGSTAHIEYYGDVAPRVTIDPAPAVGFPGRWLPRHFPDMMDIGAIIERMNRQRDAILERMRRLPRHRAGPGATASVASYGSLPPGTTKVSVVSISNGSGTCTRTTHVRSQGKGNPPEIVTNVSGDCSRGEGGPADPAATAEPADPLDQA